MCLKAPYGSRRLTREKRRTDCSRLSSAQETFLGLTRFGDLGSISASGISAAAAMARSAALRWSVFSGRGPPSLVSVYPAAPGTNG